MLNDKRTLFIGHVIGETMIALKMSHKEGVYTAEEITDIIFDGVVYATSKHGDTYGVGEVKREEVLEAVIYLWGNGHSNLLKD